MRAQLRAAMLGQLRAADLELTPGRYVVLSSDREPLVQLVTLLAGAEPPRRGLVLLDGQAPSASPETRRKLAVLLGEEVLPPAQSVLQSVKKALTAQGLGDSGAARLLESAGLSELAELAPASLSPRETRSLGLALALGHERAELVALHEPLATLVPPAFVLERLDQLTARGAIVLSTTTSAADASALGGQWLCVELGRLRAAPEPGAPRLGAGPWQQVLVETNDARALSQLLHDSPHGLSTELGSSADSLKVTGPALDVTVQELIALARQHELELRRIEASVPPVEALLAARAGFARAAYEASRALALGGAAATPAAQSVPSAAPPEAP